MDVGGLGLDGLLQDEVDEADDRGLAGGGGDVLVGLDGLGLVELTEEVLHRGGRGFAVGADDGGVDLVGVGHGELDVTLQDERQFADRGGIERVLGDQDDLAGLVRHGHDEVLVGLRGLEEPQDLRAGVDGDGRIELDLKMVGHGLEQGRPVDEARVQEGGGEGLAGGGMGLPELIGLGGVDEAGLKGDFADGVAVVVEHGGQEAVDGRRRALMASGSWQ